MPDGANERNGLGLEPMAGPGGDQLFFSLDQVARLLDVSRSTVEGRTKLDATAEDHLPSELLALDGARRMRWIPAEAVLAKRARLLERLGASEKLPNDPGDAPLAEEPIPYAGSEADRPQSDANIALQARIAGLEEHVRLLEDDRQSLTATTGTGTSSDRTRQVIALEEQVRVLQADIRDMLAADAAKSDVIRRHVPVGSLND